MTWKMRTIRPDGRVIRNGTRPIVVRATHDARERHATTRAFFVAVDHPGDAPRSDAVAGSEFVDDRIRLQES